MNTNMIDQINDAIKQNIPEQLSVELRAYLSDYSKIKEQNDEYLKLIETLKKENDFLRKEKESLLIKNHAYEGKEGELSKRELIIKDKELQQALDKFAVQKEIEKVSLMSDLVKTIFKNKELTTYTQKSGTIPIPVQGNSNYSPYVSSQPYNENTSVKVVEE